MSNTKKPFYKTWWFITIIILLVAGTIYGAATGDLQKAINETSTPLTPSAKPATEATSKSPSPTPSTPKADTPLTASEADFACTMYGKNKYPSFKDDELLISRIEDDGTATIKRMVKITNDAGVQQRLNMECYVSGTNESPVVTDFVLY